MTATPAGSQTGRALLEDAHAKPCAQVLPPSGVVAPTWDDPVARAASPSIGGLLGQRTRPGRQWWTPLRLLVVLWLVAAVVAIGVKAPCYEQGWGANADAQSSKQELKYQYVRQCYSDVAWLGAAQIASPGWFFTPDAQGQPVAADAPVLTSLVKDATARLVGPQGSVVAQKQIYFTLNALLLLLCWLLVVLATARLSGRRVWDASLVALSPAIILAGLVSFDLWAVLATSLSLWAWARKKPVLAGVLLAVALGFSFYPLMMVVPLLVLCLRAGRLRAGVEMLGAAVVSTLVIYGVALIAAPQSWVLYLRQWREAPAGLGSLWYAAHLQQWQVAADGKRLTLLVVGLTIAGVALVGLLALVLRRRPRLAQVAFLAVAVLVLVNKTYSVQHMVWLVPLAVLARPRWRDLLIWQAGQAVYFVAVWLFLVSTVADDGANRALGGDAYSLAILIQVGSLLWLVAMVIRDMLNPDHDPVRQVGMDDPAGGVLDEVADRHDQADDPVPPAPQPALV